MLASAALVVLIPLWLREPQPATAEDAREPTDVDTAGLGPTPPASDAAAAGDFEGRDHGGESAGSASDG